MSHDIGITTATSETCRQPLAGERVCCSWSGGKDSCLALHRALADGALPEVLLTMCTEGGERTRSHGLPRSVIEAQAKSLGLQLRTVASSWDNYEQSLIELLRGVKADGIEAAIFGDIDIPRHRAWEEQVCTAAGIRAFLPLWQTDRLALLEEWWQLGFEARIIAVRDGVIGREFLGRRLDSQTAKELVQLGVDACGENGEFHTVVTDGPIFRYPIRLVLKSQVLLSGCWFQDVALEDMMVAAHFAKTSEVFETSEE